MTQRVLMVEDDESVREAATLHLERAGFEVEGVGDGADALARLDASPFDLVILDLMLPTMNGFDVCKAIRATSAIPIVILTARADTADVVTGLELGADDYITKPFEPAELTARARAAVRRTGTDSPSTITVADLSIDTDAFRVVRGREELTLTATEFRLLVALVSHAGQVMSRETLLDVVWGYDYLGDSRLVDMGIRRLRAKLGEQPDGEIYITTVRSVGYRFERD